MSSEDSNDRSSLLGNPAVLAAVITGVFGIAGIILTYVLGTHNNLPGQVVSAPQTVTRTVIVTASPSAQAGGGGSTIGSSASNGTPVAHSKRNSGSLTLVDGNVADLARLIRIGAGRMLTT